MGKQTISQLALHFGVSPSTIKRRLREIELNWEAPGLEGESGFLNIDATYWGRGQGILLAIDQVTGKALHLEFIKNERTQDYLLAIESIRTRGYKIQGIVLDGQRNLFRSLEKYPLQMCHYHMKRIVYRYLTRHPKLLASRELLSIIDTLHKAKEFHFQEAYQEWKERWKETLQRRSYYKSGKMGYRHRRLRSATHSLDFFLPYLFTFQKEENKGMANTNNKIEGTFTALKNKMRLHSGMSSLNRKRLISGFFLAWKDTLCNSKKQEEAK